MSKINLTIIILLILCSGIIVGAEKGKDNTITKTWENNQISVTAELNKQIYEKKEAINLTVTIKNDSSGDIVLRIIDGYKNFGVSGNNIKLKQLLPETDEYRKYKDVRTIFRSINQKISPGKSYSYQTINLKKFLIFESSGNFSISINGCYFTKINDNNPVPVVYEIENLVFQIKE